MLVPWLDADPQAYLVGYGPVADLVKTAPDPVRVWTGPGSDAS